VPLLDVPALPPPPPQAANMANATSAAKDLQTCKYFMLIFPIFSICDPV
jgi:hypothetical protein